MNNRQTQTKPKKVPKFYLKDRLFNQVGVEKLAKELKSAHSPFVEQSFMSGVLAEFPNLELKARMGHIATMLYQHLPTSYETAVAIIIKALPPPLDNSRTDGDYGDFIYGSYGEYVARYGLSPENVNTSLSALGEISQRFSAEYAIRHFLNSHPKETLAQMQKWSKSHSYHLRRLACEGTRPRLPWGIKVGLHYKDSESILDNLFADNARYVTRSVANHLNDIAKIDEAFVRQKLANWEESGRQKEKEMAFIKRHSLRSVAR